MQPNTKESEEFDNPYSYTRSVRLKLEHCSGALPATEQQEFSLPSLYGKAMKLGAAVMHWVYLKYEDLHSPTEENYNPACVGQFEKNRFGQYILSKLVKVNKKWLKLHYKQEFYEAKAQALQRKKEAARKKVKTLML